MEGGYIKDHKTWSEYSERLDVKKFQGFFREREVWWCAFGTNIGSELDGKNESFERPALILKKSRSDLAVVIPLTSKITSHKDRILTVLAGQSNQLVLSQIRTISQNRLLRKIGYLKKALFNEVVLAVIRMIVPPISEDETPPDGGESRSPKAT